MTIPHSSAGGLAAWLLILGIAGPSFCLGRVPPAINGKLRALASQAKLAESQHDYAAAARDYTEILRLREVPEIRANLGLMDHLLGQYAQAVENFKVAVHEQPSLFVANFFLGLDFLRLHCPQEALDYLLKADHLSGNNPQVKLALGRTYATLGQFGQANQNFYLAVGISPRNIDALYGLGITYMSLERLATENIAKLKGARARLYSRLLLGEAFASEGRPHDSVRLYHQILTVTTPKVSGLHTALGFDDLRLGNYRQAAMEFNAELRTHPQFLPAWLGLAEIDLQMRRLDRAASILERIWRVDPDFLQANVCRLSTGMDSASIRSLESQVENTSEIIRNPSLRQFLRRNTCTLGAVTPDVVSGSSELGQRHEYASIYLHRADGPSATDLYEKGRYNACAEELKQEERRLDRAGLDLLTECRYRNGDYRVAFLVARRSVKSDPDDPVALYWLARSSRMLSLKALLAVGLINPNTYQVHMLLGQAYLAINHFGDAENEYRMAVNLSHGNPVALLGLGTAYWKDMKFDQALPYVKRCITADPRNQQANYILGEMLVEHHRYTQARPYLLRAAAGLDRKMALYADAMLGKVDAAQKRIPQAVAELQKGLPVDEDGSLHFQLYLLYRRLGNKAAAAAALQESETIRKKKEHNLELQIYPTRGIEGTKLMQ